MVRWVGGIKGYAVVAQSKRVEILLLGRKLVYLQIMIRIILLWLLWGSALGLWAQGGDASVTLLRPAVPTMATLWASIPDTLMPLLGERERMDARDYAQSGMRAEVSNALGGKSVLDVLTDRYVQLRLTAASIWQARLLPLSSGEAIVCVIHTLTTKTPCSTIAFYSTAWQPLPLSRYLPAALATADHRVWTQWQLSVDTDSLTQHSQRLLATAPGAVGYAATTTHYAWQADRFVSIDTAVP